MTRKILLVYIYAVSSRARSKVHLTVGPSTSCGELKPFLSFLAPGASRNLEQPDIPGNEMGISLCLAGVPRGEAIANVVNSRTIHFIPLPVTTGSRKLPQPNFTKRASRLLLPLKVP